MSNEFNRQLKNSQLLPVPSNYEDLRIYTDRLYRELERLYIDMSNLINLRTSDKFQTRAYLNVDQAGIGVTDTLILLDKVDYDKGNNFDLTNHWFVVPLDGLYLIQAQIWWNPTVAGEEYIVKVYADSAVKTYSNAHSASSSYKVITQLNTMLMFTKGQKITLTGYQTNAGGSTAQEGYYQTFMEIKLVG